MVPDSGNSKRILNFSFYLQFMANQTEDLIFSSKSLLQIHSKSDLTLDGRVGSRLLPMLAEKSSESVQISRTMTPIESFATIPFVPTPPVFPWSLWCPNLQHHSKINTDPAESSLLKRKLQSQTPDYFRETKKFPENAREATPNHLYLRIAFETRKKTRYSPVILEFVILCVNKLSPWRVFLTGEM